MQISIPNLLSADRRPYAILVVCAIIITLTISFLDEGYYSFSWMKNPGDWIAFFMYSVILFSLEYLIYFILIELLGSKSKTALSLSVGIGIILLILLIAAI